MPETNERQKEVIEGGCRVQVVTFRGSRALDGQGNSSESEIPHLAGNGMLSARKYCGKLRRNSHLLEDEFGLKIRSVSQTQNGQPFHGIPLV